MSGINKVILIGNIGNDIELRNTASGTAVANISMATSRKWKDKDGNPQEETEWHKVVLWGRQAEVLNEYARKGSRIYIEGRLQTRDWETDDGQKRYTTEVVCETLQLLDSRSDTNQSAPDAKPAATADIPF